MKRLLILVLLLLLGSIAAACEPEDNNEREIRVALVADGSQRSFVFDRPISVEQFLRQGNVVLSPLDEVNPSKFTQITDGMTITVVRVTESEECQEQAIPFGTDERPTTDLEPGQRQLIERGENGTARVCDRIILADGVVRSRNFSNQFIIQEPKNEIVAVGRSSTLDPIVIEGTIAYLASGQAWMIRGNSSSRTPLTIEGELDGNVFDLSADGRQLLYTVYTADPNDQAFENELWVILDTNNPTPIKLPYEDILTAEWLPGRPYSFYYSSAKAGTGLQGWEAYNDLWEVTLNPRDGDILESPPPIIEDNVTGEFAFWGTRFAWSPDGTNVAYAKSNGVGLIDFEAGDFGPFAVSFPYYNTAILNGWVWQPPLSWSPDGEWVVMTVHGSPYSSESPTDSIIFDIGVFKVDGTLVLKNLITRTGIWANPIYSPQRLGSNGQPTYNIAFLQAREPLNSYGTEYDLMIADRDGSNPERIFPPTGLPGIRPVTLENAAPFVWSPSGRQIAVLYQNNLWVVEIETGLAQQITDDGHTSAPRWTN
jgi:hypothetical protein